MSSGVLVGYDGSDHADAAVEWAATEAQSRDTSLTIVTAMTVSVQSMRFGGNLITPDLIGDLLDRTQEAVDARAEQVRASHPGLAVTTRVSLGTATSVFIDASEGADLLVVGSRGMGGFRGMLVGSVGVGVAANARCPAVIVRRVPASSASTVVVGIDGSDLSMAALDFAVETADRRGWSVCAVHAWEVPSYDVLALPAGPPPMDVEWLEEGERRAFAESMAGQRERHPSVAFEEVVVRGPAARAILDASDDAALIVLGTRGRGEFLGAVLGSVSQSVLHRAKVPVAVIGPVN